MNARRVFCVCSNISVSRSSFCWGGQSTGVACQGRVGERFLVVAVSLCCVWQSGVCAKGGFDERFLVVAVARCCTAVRGLRGGRSAAGGGEVFRFGKTECTILGVTAG